MNRDAFYNNFVSLYPVSKTLRVALKPEFETEENVKRFIEEDEQRDKDYKVVKKILDGVHRTYIDNCMSAFQLSDLESYYSMFGKIEFSEELEKLKVKMRKAVSNAMPDKPLIGKDNFNEVKDLISDPDERALLEKFKNFVTYFTGYNETRENIYTSDEIATSVGFRLINDNLPKFISNIRIVQKAIESIGLDKLNTVIYENNLNWFIDSVEKMLDVNFYNKVLTQKGITAYNQLLGGFTTEDGQKIKGINEHINLYNQSTKEKSERIGILSMLYKQILSERIDVSFLPEKFGSDEELLNSLKDYSRAVDEIIGDIVDLFKVLSSYELSSIYIKNGEAITNISQKLAGDWSYIKTAIENEYDLLYKPKKETKKYLETKKKDLKRVSAYSITALNAYLGDCKCEKFFCECVEGLAEKFKNCYAEFINMPEQEKLIKNDVAVPVIKNLCDSIKDLQWFMKPFLVNDLVKDEVFYGRFNNSWDLVDKVTPIYNKVRDYLTQKPYSDEKFKLNFSNSHFLTGWDKDYDTKKAHIFKYNNNYYLGIIDKKLSEDEVKAIYSEAGDAIHYRYDFQKPDNKNVPRKFIRSKKDRFAPSVEKYNLPINDILDIYDSEKFKTEYRKVNPTEYKIALTKLIDYFKLGFTRDEDYKDFEMKWKNTEDYNNISEFYNDVATSCYKLTEEKIIFEELKKLVGKGKMYLFRLYTKDFSEYSKGTPNLHTLYLKMLFAPENLANPIYKLSGGAEMFFRKKSLEITETTVHKKDEEIKNKRDDNPKKTSKFGYDIVKDRRFTVDKFFLHISIEANFNAKASNKSAKNVANQYIKYNDDIYAIGIDRGEKNLLYLCVVNSKGEIVEQRGLNCIDGIDYSKKLGVRADDRKNARQQWRTVENISNLKKGYLSLAIHEIVELMMKYNAILVLEDLNRGFKRLREGKFEKSVYQEFEKMLINKLNYMVDKHIDENELGGLFNALQLTDKFTSFKDIGRQNGIMFYVPASLTSKIDPVTGFVDLFYLKNKNKENLREFFSKFNSIGYNEAEGYFEFDFDYKNFTARAEGIKTKWTVCTYGERILTEREKDANNSFKKTVINLNKEFTKLFKENNIEVLADMKEDIISQNSKEFYMSLFKLFKLTVQLRNSDNKGLDYIISPVKDKNGAFFDSNSADESLPKDADANGAYNIARKGLIYMDIIRNTEDKDLFKPKLEIKEKNWLDYAQTFRS